MTDTVSAASHHGSGYAKRITARRSTRDREGATSSFPARDRFEVLVDLRLILGRGLVVRAADEPALGVGCPHLLRKRRRGLFERHDRLLAEQIPLREVLLERLRTRRGHHHPLSLEREPGAALREARIFPSQLVYEISDLAKLAQRLFAELRQVDSSRAATSFGGLPAIAGCLACARIGRCRAASPAGCLEGSPESIELVPQLLRPGQPFGQPARLLPRVHAARFCQSICEPI